MNREKAIWVIALGTLILATFPFPERISWQVHAQALTGGRVVFSSTVNGEDFEIYIMNEDGTGQTRLTDNVDDDNQPKLRPDLSKIVFVSLRDGNPELYLMNSDGTNVTRLTSNTGWDGDPAYRPDGVRIAFASDRDGNAEIYTLAPNSIGTIRLTNNSAEDHRPAYRPDGSRIAFASDRDGNFEIYVMNADGTGQTRLTNNAAWDDQPSFSPSGTQLVFSSNRDGNFEIYKMNDDGTSITRLTNNGSDDTDPTFSPDGTKIAFTCNLGPPLYTEICVMNADGTGLTTVANNSAQDVQPDWRNPSAAPRRQSTQSDRKPLSRSRISAVQPKACNQEPGIFRRVYSLPGHDPLIIFGYGATSARVYLPTKVPPQQQVQINNPSVETTYVMVGGWGATGGAIDAGFQYSWTFDNWALFLRLEGRSQPLFVSPTRFRSDQDALLQFEVQTTNRVRVTATGDFYSGGGGTIQSPVLNVWGNWRSDGAENRMKRTTSVAQGGSGPVQTGSYLREVHWQNVGIGRSLGIAHPWGEEDTDLPAGSCLQPTQYVSIVFDSWADETVHIDTR